jgi:hypothetical protein
MYSHEQLIEFHDEARRIKEHWWYKHKEPDLYPILVVRWRDMQPQSVDVQKVGSLIEKFRDLAMGLHLDSWITKMEFSAPLVLWSCLSAAADGVQMPGIEHTPPKGTPMEGIWLACEGYSLESVDDEEAAQIVRGDWKRDYQTNPESKVLEQLMTYQVETSSTGLPEWGRVTSAFHKGDGGVIVWHEPRVDTSDDEMPEGGFDHLLEIMTPHVTREKLA